MGRTRVKICGITRAEDGVAAVNHGVDALGLVFYPPSPRAVSVAQAQRIVAALPPLVSLVALFVNPSEVEVQEVLQALPIGLLQFHGDETPGFCASFGRPFIKAVRMEEGTDLHAEAVRFAGACGLLIDSFSSQARGGTGETFDWTEVPEGLPLPLIVAGGLHPGNVAEAVARLTPYAVDVSSGVEAEKGIKDEQRIAEFIRAVAQADLDRG